MWVSGVDLLDDAILHVDIGMKGLIVIHNPPTFDQKPVTLLGRETGETKEG